ncbi:unnamed protein product, partial [Brassica oleracea]
TFRLKLEFLLVINHLRNATFICLRVLLLEFEEEEIIFVYVICGSGHKEEISLVDVLNMKLQNTGSS